MSSGYTLVFRRYAPFESFGGGFEGDNRRGPSMRDSVTFRTGAYIHFNRSGVTGKVGKTTGTSWLIGGSSKAKVSAKVSHERVRGNKLTFCATSAGSNPKVPGAPDIDTRVLFGALWASGKLAVTGIVSGDGFPNAEVFLRDKNGDGVLLVDYRTGSGSAGPFHRLFGGNFDNEFAKFEFIIGLKPSGALGKVEQKTPHIFTGDRGALRIPKPRTPSLGELLNPYNWI